MLALLRRVGPELIEFAPGDAVARFSAASGVANVQRVNTEEYVQCHDYDYLGSRSDGAFAECRRRTKAKLNPCSARRDTRRSSQ